MDSRYACIICAGWLTAVASAPADIIWSGEQNLSDRQQFIDLNFDSLVDLIIEYGETGNAGVPTTTYVGLLNAYVDDGYNIDGSNRILVDPSNSDLNAALLFGTLISGNPDTPLEWKGGLYAGGLVSHWDSGYQFPNSDVEWSGLLGENGNTYIGISFDVGESTHYAWVNIALGPEGLYGIETPITTSWAYESTPDTPIIAGAIPEPSTSILSVGGSLALLFLARSRHHAKQGRAPIARCHIPKASTTPKEW